MERFEKSEIEKEKYNCQILEIGCGGTIAPWLGTSENRKEYQGAHIVRIDLGGPQQILDSRTKEIRGSLKSSKELDERMMSKYPAWHGQIEYLQADAVSLPFKENKFDEILMENVIGYPNKDKEEISKIFKECQRVLKKGGELIIIETYTPECAVGAHKDEPRESFEEKIKLLGKKIERFGLKIKKIEFPPFDKEVVDNLFYPEGEQSPEVRKRLGEFKKQYSYGYKMGGLRFFYTREKNGNFALVLEKGE